MNNTETPTLKKPYTFIMLFVILSYAVFSYTSLNCRSLSKTPENLYQYLAEAFLNGQFSFKILPPPELLQADDPYKFQQNHMIKFPDGQSLHYKLYDASYYKGKFYIYFGPLPVMLVYIPFKLLTGYYLPDCFVVFLFLSLGFFICYSLMLKIKNDHFPHVSELQMIVVGLLLGFANNAPFLLIRPQFYEVAISSAFFVLSIAVVFLYRMFHSNFSTKNVFFFSFFLVLSIAGRPHFALLYILITPLLFIYLYYKQKKFLKNAFALIIPGLTLGSLLLYYNFARFDSIFEFGEKYQLALKLSNPVLVTHNIKEIAFNLLYNFYNYFLSPIDFKHSIPYVNFSHLFQRRTAFGNDYEETIGILNTAPFLIFLVFFPRIMCFSSKLNTSNDYQLLQFIFFLSFLTSIIILFILSLNSATQRYASDFITFLVMLSILCFWFSPKYFNQKTWYFAEAFFTVAGIFSIYIGFMLGNYTY